MFERENATRRATRGDAPEAISNQRSDRPPPTRDAPLV
jgi:hypothetical protein